MVVASLFLLNEKVGRASRWCRGSNGSTEAAMRPKPHKDIVFLLITIPKKGSEQGLRIDLSLKLLTLNLNNL